MTVSVRHKVQAGKYRDIGDVRLLQYNTNIAQKDIILSV